MLELKNISTILLGVSVRESKGGPARFVRLSDLSDLKAGRVPTLAMGNPPDAARALTIEDGDLIIGARGSANDICVAADGLVGGFVSIDLYLVRPNPAVVDSKYLASFLELPSTQAQFTMAKQGSNLPRLPKEALERVKVPLPPIHLQRLMAGLAREYEKEGMLLKRRSELNAFLRREMIARAIRSACLQQN
jgi:hypothetical protein